MKREHLERLNADLSRRVLLKHGARASTVIGVFGLLAACGGSDRESATATSSAGGATQPSVGATQSSGTTPGSPPSVAATQAPSGGDEGAPRVGGTFVAAIPTVDTLDIHKTGDGNAMAISWLMGATMVARDPDVKYYPWLATKWESAADGLTWTFSLRNDVKFHDGSPMSANDYAWTIQRLLDPATAAPQAGRLRAVSQAEAVDDSTLRLTLSAPYPIMLEQLSNTGVVQPYSQKFVEAQGDQFGQTFMGVGPYKFKSWQTGEKVIIERNPNFTWDPPFVKNQGPYYIETMEFDIVPESSTIVAALESGDADYALVTGDDVKRLKESDKVDINESLWQGMNPALHMNMSRPPFDDLNVRKAFNLAVDRDNLVKVVVNGEGQPQYGPLSPTIKDYWPDVEQVGYHFDLDQAKKLMGEAGYTAGGDGILAKDGQPFQLSLKSDQAYTKLAQVLQEQYKALGADLKIEIVETALLFDQVTKGDYDISIFGYGASESDILYRWFHTSRTGAINPSRASDPELDRLLDLTRSTIDLDKRTQTVYDVQKYLVEQAFVVPLYMPKEFTAVAKRVKGELFSPPSLSATLKVFLNDAWIADS